MMSRGEVEDFLFAEAALLDEWRLDAWLALWTADGRYIVPAPDAMDDDPDATLALIADDMAMLRARIEQLRTDTTWAEIPRSRTTRMIGNVRILEQDAAKLRVSSSLIVHRSHRDRLDVFAGTVVHRLTVTDGTIRIREKWVRLVHEHLYAQGRISIVL